MNAACTRDSRAGFALIDMLVALAVAGLAGSAMLGLVAFVSGQTADALRRERARDGLVAASRVLHALLAEAPAVLGPDSQAVGLKGDAAEFTVNAMGPPVLGLERPIPFTLRVEDDGAGKALVLAWTTGSDATASRELVAEGLTSANFSYFARAGLQVSASEASWQAAWSGNEGRLDAIRLTLRMAVSASPVEIVVPIRADYPPACLRNPRRRGCLTDGS